MFQKTALGLVLGSVLLWSGAAFGANPNAVAKSALNRTVPAINFTNVTLRDAIDFLKEVSGGNLHVNWKAVEAVGVTPDTMVNLRLRQVSLRKVLSTLLTEAAGGPTLTFYVDEGVIEVTTKELADGQMFTLVYPVQDLLIEPPEFVVPEFELGDSEGGSSGSGGGSSGGSGGGSSRGSGGSSRGSSGGGSSRGSSSGSSRGSSGSGSSGSGSGDMGDYGQPTAKPKEEKEKELVDMIKEIVQPETWIDNGGKSSVRVYNGNLIVTAPRSVHEEIGGPID
jgi:hypothetical protein